VIDHTIILDDIPLKRLLFYTSYDMLIDKCMIAKKQSNKDNFGGLRQFCRFAMYRIVQPSCRFNAIWV